MCATGTGTVCVVDDNDDVRDSTRALLESCGYVVKAFASAEDYLRHPGAEDADCLLLDLNMPGMNGLELLEVLRSCGTATATIVLTANGDPLLRFIAWPEILARAPEPTRASARPIRLPVHSGQYLVPDGMFGIEYRSGDAKTYRFFALEADRGTMPIARANPKQTSYLGKLAAYREIIERRVHKIHWGIPNPLVLTVTTSAARLDEIVAKLDDRGSPTFLFKAVDERAFSNPFPDLLAEPWTRAGSPPLSIAESR